MEIKHPVTQQFTHLFIPEHNLGFLREGSPSGPRLPAFSSRGEVAREIPLNPILVNFAAMIRLRRLLHKDDRWGSHLSGEARSILKAVVDLHEAVTWDPVDHLHSVGTPTLIHKPGSEEYANPQPFHLGGGPKLGFSSSVLCLGTQAHGMAMLDLMEAQHGNFYSFYLITNSNWSS